MFKKLFFILLLVISINAKFIRYDSDKIVLDTSTSLMWQDDEFANKTWREAVKYCEGLEFASKDNWRLPNINELFSIVDLSHVNQALNPTFKGKVVAEDNINSQNTKDSFWTSTNIHSTEGKAIRAFYINFALGTIQRDSKITNSINVRCVHSIFKN